MKQGVFVDILKWGAVWLTAASVLSVAACDRNDDRPKASRPVPSVTVMAAEKADVAVIREYPARVQGSRQVQVRAMVQGILKEKLYEEGQAVAQDAVLFLIDPEPYEIALRRARAERADARANHENSLRERERYSRLFEQKAVSQQQLDRAVTQHELTRARLELAGAAVAEAERNLRNTHVRAPVSGVTDMKTLSEGNLIEWGRLLTTITQTDPLHVLFSIPERDALTQRAALSREVDGARYREATIVLPDGSRFEGRGEIDFTASTLDPKTGTVAARAVFSNPHGILVPGQFVRLRVLLEELEDVFLVPETALSQGRTGVRLFIVDGDGVARERVVRTGPAVEGLQAVLEGLGETDRVVVRGHVALRDGMKVSVDRVMETPDKSTEDRSAEEVR